MELSDELVRLEEVMTEVVWVEFCTALVTAREVFKESLQRIKDMRHKFVSLYRFSWSDFISLLSYSKLNKHICNYKFTLLHYLFSC